MHRFSLRWLLPLILFIFTLLLAMWSLQNNGKIALIEVEDDSLHNMALELDQLQRHIELELREGMLAAVQEEISTLGVDTSIETAFLSNEKGIVLASISFAEVGGFEIHSAEKHLHGNKKNRSTLFADVKANGSSHVFIEGEGMHEHVIGVYPITIGREAFELRPTKVGILYAQRNISTKKARALEKVHRQVMQFSVFLGALIILLWTFLHFTVTERIRSIIHATRKVSDGDLTVRTQVAGHDEIAEVASAIDNMISRWSTAEDMLRKLSQGVEQSGEPMLILDAEGLVEYANPAYLKVTGFRNNDVLGKKAICLIHDEGRKTTIWETIQTGNSWNGRVETPKANGEPYPSMLTISPVMNTENQIINFICIQQDLSLHESLEEQLRQSQKMEALGRLAGGIAHEFNNSLAAVTGNLYLAKQSAAANPEILERLNTIEELSFNSAELIKKLLSFTRKGIVQRKSICLNDFLQSVLKVQRVSIADNISIHLDTDAEPMFIHADTNICEQVFLNLIHNAGDALEDSDSPRINISLHPFTPTQEFTQAHPECPASNYACLTISDNGKGIKPKDLEHIFDPFFTTKGVGKGTGLGLSMVHGAIQTHHGAIDVESVENLGTKFKIYLPLAEEEENDYNSEAEEKLVDGQGETILLVDDNSAILSTGEDLLKSLNYRVITAENGQEAIAMFKANQDHISLIMLDVVMPIMGGIEAAKLLRSLDPAVNIIFSTGYDRDSLRKSDNLNNEIVIMKPFKMNILSKVIRNQIEKK